MSQAISDRQHNMSAASLTAFNADHVYLDFLSSYCFGDSETVNNDGRACQSIARITAVGAVYEDPFGFSARDMFWFRNAFLLCDKLGAAISNQFQITPVNRLHKQDFLDRGQSLPATDLLLVCFVVDPNTAQGMEHRRNRKGDTAIWVSPHHSNEKWVQTASAAGAKLIITFSDYTLGQKPGEMRSENFTGTGDFRLCASEVIVGPDESNRIERRTAYLMECMAARNAGNIIANASPDNALHATP